jgi:iron(III) transport system ATP-binding protein
MLHEVYTILRALGTTAVFVTHDQEEALMVADRVGVLNQGRLEQLGRPEEVYHLPASRFMARFVGKANFIPGQVTQAGIATIGIFPNPQDLPQGTAVEVMIRPEQIDLLPDPAGGATVVSRRFRGIDALVVQLPLGLMLHSYQPSTMLLQTRERVRVMARPTHVVAFLTAGP